MANLKWEERKSVMSMAVMGIRRRPVCKVDYLERSAGLH